LVVSYNFANEFCFGLGSVQGGLDVGVVPDMLSGHGCQGAAAAAGDGGREARVMRYREKRRTRLFSKKIRYEVRKLNAERRPRMKVPISPQLTYVHDTQNVTNFVGAV
jgi:hypothetical protein